MSTWLALSLAALMAWGLWGVFSKVGTQHLGPQAALILGIFGYLPVFGILLNSLASGGLGCIRGRRPGHRLRPVIFFPGLVPGGSFGGGALDVPVSFGDGDVELALFKGEHHPPAPGGPHPGPGGGMAAVRMKFSEIGRGDLGTREGKTTIKQPAASQKTPWSASFP